MDRLRKERGKKQPLYLIETVDTDKDSIKEYMVMGLTGNVYSVQIKNKPECSCPDHQTRHRRCKHIYFILIRVMKVTQDNEDKEEFTDSDLETMFSNIPDVTNNLYVDTDKREKYNKLKGVTSGAKKKDTDDVCPICLDDLENGEELDYCKYSCGKPIHKECFDMWCKKRATSCVFCRADWFQKKYINLE